MTYDEFSPAPHLQGAVSSYWRFALPPDHTPPDFIHTIPPDGAVSLCWLPPGRVVVMGPRVPVFAGAEYAGIRFLPGGAGPLLNVDVPSLRDAVLPLDRPDFAAVMQAQGIPGLDALLTRWAEAAGWTSPDPTVAEITRRIVATDGAAPVADLVHGLGLSYRQILRRFHHASGLTPKEFARLRRLRAACLHAFQSANPAWAALSADTGFSDQAHLARECQDVYGWPPRLVHEYLRRITHLTVLP
ncbi:MAG: helix-turn-helix domain-containing protein [Bryobacteraceae bacterium]|nr:helix-turn-helix domain-containing protein [Bryobacteraceae bacterium]